MMLRWKVGEMACCDRPCLEDHATYGRGLVTASVQLPETAALIGIRDLGKVGQKSQAECLIGGVSVRAFTAAARS